jgi:hypothetical protein
MSVTAVVVTRGDHLPYGASLGVSGSVGGGGRLIKVGALVAIVKVLGMGFGYFRWGCMAQDNVGCRRCGCRSQEVCWDVSCAMTSVDLKGSNAKAVTRPSDTVSDVFIYRRTHTGAFKAYRDIKCSILISTASPNYCRRRWVVRLALDAGSALTQVESDWLIILALYLYLSMMHTVQVCCYFDWPFFSSILFVQDAVAISMRQP